MDKRDILIGATIANMVATIDRGPSAASSYDAHSAHRFVVEIAGEKLAAFTECTLPNLEIELQEIQEGGQNEYVHALPVRRKSGRVTLSRVLTGDATLLKWYKQILAGDLSDAAKTIAIVMFDSTGKEVARWNFQRAIPVKWTGPTLKSDQGAIAIEKLELVVHEFIV